MGFPDVTVPIRAANLTYGPIFVSIRDRGERSGHHFLGYRVLPFDELDRWVCGPNESITEQKCRWAIRLALEMYDGGLDLELEGLDSWPAPPEALQGLECYSRGQLDDALKLIASAALDGLPEALYIQGVLDVYQLAKASDPARGLRSLRRGGAQGHAAALETLHYLHLSGLIVGRSNRKARMFMRRALRAGLRYHPSSRILRQGKLVELTVADVKELWRDEN